MAGKERPSLKMKSWLSEERGHLECERSLAPGPSLSGLALLLPSHLQTPGSQLSKT